MKRRLLIVLFVILCVSSLTVLSSCDFILDIIFGPEPEKHTHNLQNKILEVSCLADAQTECWYCEGCSQYFADADAQQVILDVDALLSEGHAYIRVYDGNSHWTACKFCNGIKGEKEAHSSDKWNYDEDNHLQICDVCLAEFNKNVHEMQDGACTVCSYIVDYAKYCNSDYGYQQLATLEDGEKMQKYYNALDSIMGDAHSNSNFNAEKVTTKNGTWYVLPQVNFVQYNLDQTQAFTVLSSYRNDHPLYYWISNSVLTSSSQAGHIALKVCVEEEYAQGNVRVEQNAKLYKSISQYMQLVQNENNAYRVAEIFHNKIIDSIDYAYTNDGHPQEERWAHSIIGVFERKSAVCEGYAKAFQALLNAKGINNIYVTGQSNNQGHAWNLVQMDNGGWYWYDLTWDDQPNIPSGKIYDYFCKTDSEFPNHKVSDEKEGLDYLYDLPDRAPNRYNQLLNR